MVKISNKVLPEHKDKFEGFVHKWQILLGLQDWRISVRYPTKTKNMAETTIDTPAREAAIDLGNNFGADAPSDYNLESLAVHELLHVVCAPLQAAYSSRNMSDEEKGTAEHVFVNLFEKIIMQKYYEKPLFHMYSQGENHA